MTMFERIAWWLLPKRFKRWVYDRVHGEMNAELVSLWAQLLEMAESSTQEDVKAVLRGER